MEKVSENQEEMKRLKVLKDRNKVRHERSNQVTDIIKGKEQTDINQKQETSSRGQAFWGESKNYILGM